MESNDPPISGVNMNFVIERCREILLEPRTSWAKIKNEAGSVREIYISFLAPMAAIAGVCSFIGVALVGSGGVRAPFFSALIQSIVHVIVQLVMIYLSAIVIVKLAPKFEAATDEVSALKLVGYSMTALFVGEMLLIIPAMSPTIVLFGMWTIYTFFQGIPTMTNVPEHRRAPFLVTSLVAMTVLFFLITTIGTLFVPAPAVPRVTF